LLSHGGRALTSVRTKDEATDNFTITITINKLYLFTLVLDVFTRHLRARIKMYVFFFVEDVVLLGDSREKLNGRLKTSLKSVWYPP